MNVAATEYAGIILSIIILVYSIINSNSRYSERVQYIESALNDVKALKRRLGGIVKNTEPDSDERFKEFEELKLDYEDIVGSVEYRDDLDFYHTVCYLCKKFGINIKTGEDIDTKCDLSSLNLTEKELSAYKDEIRGYIAEIKPGTQKFHICIHIVWHLILYAFPIAVFIACMLIK